MSPETKAPPKYATLELQTNLLLSCTLKAAYWFKHETYGEKLKGLVVVTPEQATEAYPAGTSYLFFFQGAERLLLEAGALTELPEREGKRQFRVQGAPLLTLMVREVRDAETGKKKKHTSLTINGAEPGASPAPAAPTPAAAPAPAPRASAPAPAPSNGEEAQRAARKKLFGEWVAYGEAYEVAAHLAYRALSRTFGGIPLGPEHLNTVHAGASTILIQAYRDGNRGWHGQAEQFQEYLDKKSPVPKPTFEQALATPPTRKPAPRPEPTKAQLEEFEQMPAALQDDGEEMDDGLPF